MVIVGACATDGAQPSVPGSSTAFEIGIWVPAAAAALAQRCADDPAWLHQLMEKRPAELENWALYRVGRAGRFNDDVGRAIRRHKTLFCGMTALVQERPDPARPDADLGFIGLSPDESPFVCRHPE